MFKEIKKYWIVNDCRDMVCMILCVYIIKKRCNIIYND